MKAMDINSCKRCCLRCQNKHDAIAHKYIAGNWPEVATAPDPTLVLWENLGKGGVERCGRRTASYIMAFILLLIGFSAIIYLLNVQAQYKLDITACGEKTYTKDEAEENFK